MKPLVFPGLDSTIVPPGQISALRALSQSRSRFPLDAEADPRPNPLWLYIVLYCGNVSPNVPPPLRTNSHDH